MLLFLAERLGAQVDTPDLESAGGGRPRRGVAKRRVRNVRDHGGALLCEHSFSHEQFKDKKPYYTNGAFVVDCEWRDGRPTAVTVRSLRGNVPRLRHNGKTLPLAKKGSVFRFTP